MSLLFSAQLNNELQTVYQVPENAIATVVVNLLALQNYCAARIYVLNADDPVTENPARAIERMQLSTEQVLLREGIILSAGQKIAVYGTNLAVNVWGIEEQIL